MVVIPGLIMTQIMVKQLKVITYSHNARDHEHSVSNYAHYVFDDAIGGDKD